MYPMATTTSSPRSAQNPPVALVTGASSGVGYELVGRLLGAGWRVLALQRSAVPLENPVVSLGAREGRLSSHAVDLSRPAQLMAKLAQLSEAEPSIDLVVNNAGVSLPEATLAPSGRDLHFEVNVLAPYLITQALLPNVAASQHRTVLQVSSNALLHVKNFSREELLRPSHFRKLLGPYAASKLALSLWTSAMATSLTGDVTLLSACPGGSDTPMTRSAAMPMALRMLVPFLFRHPRKSADALLATTAAFGGAHTSGSFIQQGRQRSLPHQDRAAEVLSWVQREAERPDAAHPEISA